ncbi:MAG: hypothetical protein GY731_07725 [Gammaproteobacteria bacterium]|nr:hypothetical protein [Gammaproteobacteria bacterium]
MNNTGSRQQLLQLSLERLGMLTPLLVYVMESGELQLMHGFNRLEACRNLGWEAAPCHLLPPQTPLTDRLELLISCHWQTLQDGIIPRVRLLHLALQMGLSREDAFTRIMPLLRFEGHERVLRRCESVAALPSEVLDFCEVKGFSLKQCVHLTRHPPELLALVFTWREQLSLTASIIEELLEQIKDYLHANNLKTGDFLNLPAIREIIADRCSLQERTRRMRQLVRTLRYPLLTEIQHRMENIRNRMDLPANVRTTWDPSLEQRAVVLHITLNNPEVWSTTQLGLASPSVAQGIDKLLEEL